MDVINLTDRRTAKIGPAVKGSGYSFSKEVDNDIERLSSNLGITKEQAVNVATDFYRKYPMLIEHVRSPQHLLRK